MSKEVPLAEPEISYRNPAAPLKVPVPYIWTVDYSDWDGIPIDHYEFASFHKSQFFVGKWGGKFHIHQIMMMDNENDELRYKLATLAEDAILANAKPFIAAGLEKLDKPEYQSYIDSQLA